MSESETVIFEKRFSKLYLEVLSDCVQSTLVCGIAVRFKIYIALSIKLYAETSEKRGYLVQGPCYTEKIR